MANQNEAFAGLFADEKPEPEPKPTVRLGGAAARRAAKDDRLTPEQNQRLREAMDAFHEAGRQSAATMISKLPERLYNPLTRCLCGAAGCLPCAERATIGRIDRSLAALRRR